MESKQDKVSLVNVGIFNPQKSIQRARNRRAKNRKWVIVVSGDKIMWGEEERLSIIRNGLPYEAIEVIGLKANLSIKQVLHHLGLVQTTYNKKKRKNERLNVRNSEIVLILSELLDFGLDVFNNEKEKFHRWLKKKNISLGGVSPESLFDSVTGIQEVKNALSRLEYGNMA